MKNYAEEERSLCHPRKMMISSLIFGFGTLISPLLLFCLQLGLVCTNIHRFVDYTPKICFNGFVQSAEDGRRQVDENLNTRVVADTTKLVNNNSYGYQIKDWSGHTVKKYLSDKKAQAAFNSRLLEKRDHVNISMFAVELARAQIEHKEPKIVGFFVLQYAKLRMLELYLTYFTNCCDVNNFEVLQLDTISLYMAPVERKWKTASDFTWERNGRGWDQMILSIVSLLMLWQFSFQEEVL